MDFVRFYVMRFHIFITCLAILGGYYNGNAQSHDQLENLHMDSEPSDHAVDGWIEVQVIGEKDDLLLVRLPAETLGNGRTVTVRRSQGRSFKSQQEA